MENSLMNNYAPLSPVIEKGEGVKLYDTTGKEYIDFTSGIGVNCLGYNHPKWVSAISNQAKKLQHCSNIFLNPVTVELSNKLTKAANFFANSGAEANEGAIKLARKYSFDKYGEGRATVLTLKQSFHGRTITTLMATGQDKFHKYFMPFTEGFDYTPANDIEEFKKHLTDDVCAVMMEAVQGEGGVHPLNKDFVQEVCKICNEKDILIIFDEVQAGMARTGKLFGFEHFHIKADIVSMAKGLGAGLPIGAVLCNEKAANTFKPGDHGSTFGGNPVVCAGALVVLDELCNEESFKAISKKSEIIKNRINEAKLENVVEVRGLGLMLGIEIKEGTSADVQKAAMEKGLFVLTAGPKVVRLLPPLVISEEDLQKGLDILISVLA